MRKKMKKKEFKLGDEFTLTEQALQVHLKFLKEKGLSIIGKNCPMLTALNMVLHKTEGLEFLMPIIETMIKEGKIPPSESMIKGEKISIDQDRSEGSYLVDSLDKHLPKISKDKKWIYSIEDFLQSKIRNAIKTDWRRGQRKVPLLIKDKEGKVVDNPELDKINRVLDTIDKIAIKEALDILTPREKGIYVLKETSPYTGKVIAEILHTTEDVVKHDYKKANEKIRQWVKLRKN